MCTRSRCFVFALLAASASTAMAVDNNLTSWTLYVFGYGDLVQTVLAGVVSLVHSALFSGLVHLIMLVGLAGLLLTNVLHAGLSLFATTRYLLLTALIVRLLTGFYINIALVDVVYPQNNQVITQVPLFLGLPAAVFSQIGYRFAAAIDEAYAAGTALPLALTLTGGQEAKLAGVPYGMAFNMLQTATQLQINDALLKASLTHFVADCWLPMTAQEKIGAQLLTQKNLWQSMGRAAVNPAMTLYYGIAAKQRLPLGEVSSCMASYRCLDRDLQSINSAWLARWHNRAEPLFNKLVNYLFADTADKKSLLLASYLRQAALLSIVSDALPNLINRRMMILSYEHRWRARFDHVFWHQLLSSLGYLYAVLQALVYALTPLLLLLLLYPAARTTVLKIYLQSLAWFPLTLILLTVTNDMGLTWLKHRLWLIASVAGGVTLANKPLIIQLLAQVIAISQWLMALMPVLTWGILHAMRVGIQRLLVSVERLYPQQTHDFHLAGHHNTTVSTLQRDASTVASQSPFNQRTHTVLSSQIINEGIAAINRRFIYGEEIDNE